MCCALASGWLEPFSARTDGLSRLRACVCSQERERPTKGGVRLVYTDHSRAIVQRRQGKYIRLREQIAEPFAWAGGVRIQTAAMQATTMKLLLRPPLAAAAVVMRAAEAEMSSVAALVAVFCAPLSV